MQRQLDLFLLASVRRRDLFLVSLAAIPGIIGSRSLLCCINTPVGVLPSPLHVGHSHRIAAHLFVDILKLDLRHSLQIEWWCLSLRGSLGDSPVDLFFLRRLRAVADG